MIQPDLFSFFNSINEKERLPEFEKQAFTQEEKVLQCFSKGKRTALECADELKMHESSARRSVTNLMHKGFLIKLNEQKKERYGKKNYYYSLK